jgi:hypothetical protein
MFSGMFGGGGGASSSSSSKSKSSSKVPARVRGAKLKLKGDVTGALEALEEGLMTEPEARLYTLHMQLTPSLRAPGLNPFGRRNVVSWFHTLLQIELVQRRFAEDGVALHALIALCQVQNRDWRLACRHFSSALDEAGEEAMSSAAYRKILDAEFFYAMGDACFRQQLHQQCVFAYESAMELR